MSAPVVCLSIDHIGKPHGAHPWFDRGAQSPSGWLEVDLTLRYALAAEREFRRLGRLVCLLTDGTYAERWERADRYGASLYASLHADAGGGDRGTVYCDHRSTRGLELAGLVTGEIDDVVPWHVGLGVLDELTRGWACIHGVRAPAILVEPGFVDGAVWHDVPKPPGGLGALRHHEILWDSADAIGVALARGIDAWLSR